jgi:hypothetical protein
LLGPFGDHLEQELGADLGQGDVADLVDGDQVVARPAGQDPSELELLLGLDQLVDQVGGRGETDPPLLAAGRDAEGGQEVGLDGVKRMPSSVGLHAADAATRPACQSNSSARTIGSSHPGQVPPSPSDRQKRLHSAQRR